MLSRFPRREVAGLTGNAWIEFLDQTLLLSEKSSGLRFDGEIGRLLLRAPYSPRVRTQQVDMDSLDRLLQAFIHALPDTERGSWTTRWRRT